MQFLLEATLRSRITRIKASGDPLGVRRIKKTAVALAEAAISGLSWLARKFAGLVGFVFGSFLKLLPFSVSGIFSFLVNAYFQLKTFDWNQTDKAIQDRIDANNKRLRDGLAPLLGSAAGWGVVRLANLAIGKLGGVLEKGKKPTPGISIPVLSARVALKLAEESQEEVGGQFKSYFETVKRAQIENGVLAAVLTSRNMNLFGWKPISAPLPNASFQAKIESEIEKLPGDWQNFAEEFLEEFEEALIEACYIVAFEADDYMLMLKKGLEKDKGKTIEVTIEDGGITEGNN